MVTPEPVASDDQCVNVPSCAALLRNVFGKAESCLIPGLAVVPNGRRSIHFPCSHARIATPGFDEIAKFMTTEQELRQKLRKISALFEGATTTGERDAAAAAIDRVRKALAAAEQIEKPVETYFKLVDQWNRRLFTALCRRYGLKPYRYPRQHRTTVVLRAPKSFIDETLWPEYLQLEKALHEYLNEATERIIREEVFGNSNEAEERAG
jgi:hypothetical protein